MTSYLGLIPTPTLTWGGAMGRPQVVTYSFQEIDPLFPRRWMHNQTVGEAVRQFLRDGFAEWATVSGLTFVELPSRLGPAPPFPGSWARDATNPGADIFVRSFFDWQMGGDRRGYASPPGVGAVISLPEGVGPADSLLGEALGLQPIRFDYNATEPSPGFVTPAPGSTYQNTVMVIHERGSVSNTGATLTAPGLWDTQAIQALYGTPAQRAAEGLTWRYDAAADRVEGLGTARDDVLRGTPYRDALLGGAGNDQLSGHAGDDLLRGGAGDDVLDGGAGRDTVIFDALRGESAVNLRAGTVSSVFGGSDGVANAELLRFAEGRVTLDVLPLSNEAIAIGLYRVLLDLAPDAGGLAYWVMRMDEVGAQNVAAGIIAHQAYQDRVAGGLARADMAPWTAVELAKQVAAAAPAEGVWVPDAAMMTLARLYQLGLGRAPTAAELRAEGSAHGSGVSFAAIGQTLLERNPGPDPYADGATLAAAAQDWQVVAQFWGMAGAGLGLSAPGSALF